MPSSYICLMNCTKVVFSEQRTMVQPHKKTLECKNLHHYLKTLPSDVLDQLYNHPATCLAVFRYFTLIGQYSEYSPLIGQNSEYWPLIG